MSRDLLISGYKCDVPMDHAYITSCRASVRVRLLMLTAFVCGLVAPQLPIRAAIPEYRTAWQAGSALAHRDGSLGTARFDEPTGIAIDGAGNIYVSDLTSATVRKITTAGQVTTLAGSPGTLGYVDGQGTSAQFGRPYALALDGAGTVYVADGQVVRKITPAGVVTTLAGSTTATGGADGAGDVARFEVLTSIAVDGLGNVFVADNTGSTLRRITPNGQVTTFAGQYHIVGAADGKGTAAAFTRPSGVAMTTGGVLYLADANTLREIGVDGSVRTLMHTYGTTLTGAKALATDSAGNLLMVVESGIGGKVARRTPSGVVTTLAGADFFAGYVDGMGAEARFNHLCGISVAPTGDLFVTDAYNSVVRKITPAGAVSTFVGSPYRDTDGAPDVALFGLATCGIAVGADGSVYVADSGNYTIRKISSAGNVSTLAGKSGQVGAVNGAGAEARFRDAAEGLVAASDGSIYVADSRNRAIRKITREGVVTTFAGSLGQAGSEDGSLATARFRSPKWIAADPAGNLYVGDPVDRTIRKISVGGEVSTLAGAPGQTGHVDGDRAVARFADFNGLTVDPAGNVYVSEAERQTIRKITPDGTVSTIAGSPDQRGDIDGRAAAARFNHPTGLAADAAGNIYVADSDNKSIRRIGPDGAVVTLLQLAGSSPESIDLDAAGNLYVGRASGIIEKLEVVKITPTITWATPATIRAGTALSAAQLNATANTAGTFQYEPSAGTVLNPGTHLLHVTFTPTDSFNYSGVAATVALIVTEAQTIVTIEQPSQTISVGGEVTLTASTSGAGPVAWRWQRNGRNLAGSSGASLRISGVRPGDVGLYTALAGETDPVSSSPAIVGVTTTDKVIGAGEIVGSDIKHSNGNVFDQVLVNGAAEAITADWELNQITRTSFIDVDGDIVQVEFSGPGTLSLVLDGATAPALAEKYNQPGVLYVTGHAGIVIAGANENTNVSVFTVGTATAVNQALFKIGETYDGLADIAFIAISSTDGKFGGLRAANTTFFAQRGHTGIYAPGVEFTGPVYVGDVSAYDEAQPVLVLGAASDVRITGGDMLQANGRPVQVSGISQLQFTNGSDSHGHTLPAQANRAVYQENGVDVTARIVVNP